MKVNGKTIDRPNEVLLVLPRSDGDLVFKFRAVVDDSMFEKLCPEPKPPRTKDIKTGEVRFNIEDEDYKRAINDWASRQTHWQFLQSISATEGLEWETVKADDPGTWQNWRTEMVKAGFAIGEMNAIWAHFVRANSLSSDMIEEARKRFLASQEVKAVSSSSLTAEPSTSLSGEPANA